MTDHEPYIERDFGTLSDLIALHAAAAPHATALVHEEERLDYAGLNALADRIAATLQAADIGIGDRIAICALSSVNYAATFIGALRAGVAVAPLAPSSTPASLAAMVADCGARLFFVDAGVAAAVAGEAIDAPLVTLDNHGHTPFERWLGGGTPQPVTIDPAAPFNIIYSSGTTGTPKGIVQSHRMRWQHIRGGAAAGYAAASVTLLSTPLYSNTTLVSFLPALAMGGAVVLMAKFDPAAYLALAERHRMTHTMLVPVQYRRLMEHPGFDSFDLSSTAMKFSTSAPFAASLKAEVLRRWPGGLIEFWGMTEGGGGTSLVAHHHPDKLATVGRAMPGTELKLIDDDGRELPPGAAGEIVGRSGATMNGYWNRPDKTAEAQWRDAAGNVYIRTGDVGRLDADGFLTLLDRRKDMIISGGFNIYPSDLEAVVMAHGDVAEVAVVGMPSDAWGETPVAFAVARPGATLDAAALRDWANARLGKTQRLNAVRLVDSLPRSAIGKVLKRELRDG